MKYQLLFNKKRYEKKLWKVYKNLHGKDQHIVTFKNICSLIPHFIRNNGKKEKIVCVKQKLTKKKNQF